MVGDTAGAAGRAWSSPAAPQTQILLPYGVPGVHRGLRCLLVSLHRLGNVLEHESRDTPAPGRGFRSNAAPTTRDPNPSRPLPSCPSSLCPPRCPRPGITDVLALLVFLCFAPRDLGAVGLVVSFWVGLGCFLAPRGGYGLGQAPLLLQPWNGRKSPGRGAEAAGASLGWVRCLGRDNTDLPPWEAHPAFPGSGLRSWESSSRWTQPCWGCSVAQGSPGKQDGPPAPSHPDSQRVRTGQWVSPHPGPEYPPDSPLPIPHD